MQGEKLFFSGSLLAAVSLLLVGQFAAGSRVNLLTNGDFEAGNSGFTTQYNYSPGNIYADGSYDVVSNPHNDHSLAGSYGDHTSGSGMMLSLNGAATFANAVAWSETVGVAQNHMYDFSGWVSSWSQGYGPIATLDTTIDGVQLFQPFDAPVTQGVWAPFSAMWFSGSATSATITIIDLQTAPGGNDFSLDDLRFSQMPQLQTDAAPTPAPGLAGLVGFAAIAGGKLIRERRTRWA